jgi:hypothetical protein
MTGLHLSGSLAADSGLIPTDENLDNFWRFLNVGLVYLLFQHFLCVLFARVCDSSWSFLALLLSGIAIGETTLGAGLTLHLDNLYPWYGWTSPLRWVFAILLPPLHSPELMGRLKNCKAKQIQRQDIITQSTCEMPDGELALREIALNNIVGHVQDGWLLASLGILLVAIVTAFLTIKHSPSKSSLRSMPNKP